MYEVYHLKKPGSVRVVTVRLQGPYLCNSLLGVLLRFRRERVVVTMDVEQMFQNFKTPKEHQRLEGFFFWHQNNDMNLPLVDYQMTIHVFGSTALPAVATYGLRKAIENSDDDVKKLVNNNFNVDDGLLSVQTEDQASDIVLRIKQTLMDGCNIRLHKFASNSRAVLDPSPQSDLASNLKDLGIATLPMQRSLGFLWNTDMDRFAFKVILTERV
ncbi:uncharacterized protein LOC130053834 [Ostrea edulis]|uniref:uncharacterized protein LOC130053834 n=1 Tax=Ostrea edulis TaxID=37623 RepID=UPI0024AF1D96|nr:uncharacterized protein LOC130053834 [Ostrea edulis]